MIPTNAAEARKLAAALSPDPFPRTDLIDRPETTWLYAPGQYERGVLRALVRDGFAVGRNVHYARNFSEPDVTARFRTRLEPGGSATILVNGEARVRHDDVEEIVDGGPIRVDSAAGAMVQVSVVATDGDPAALAADGNDWEVHTDDGWVPAAARLGGLLPAHLTPEPSVVLTPKSIDGDVYDFGATVLGRVVVHAPQRPTLVTGESLPEVLSDVLPESRHDLVEAPEGGWATHHRLGFRYARVSGATHVHAEAHVRPVAAPGAFVCSDDDLNRIWVTAAYTIRSCMQKLNVDGIKRDRMPWAGDLALNLVSNAYTSGDESVVSDTLSALGSPTRGYVNGLADYSLWWLISQSLLRRYFAASVDVSTQADRIHEFLTQLSADITVDGILVPRDTGDFQGAGGVLIDWGVEPVSGRHLTALQVLLVWALESAGSILEQARHPERDRWASLHATALSTLRARGWDDATGAWREFLDDEAGNSPYPNFLAVLADLHPDGVPSSVVSSIDTSRVRTPFMTGFALRALGASGLRTEALERLRALWMPMLDAGATTFWEEFANPGESPFEMYGRPFGKSLCHAWGAAPASLLPELVLGVRPLADSWASVEIDPRLGALEWAAAVVPTPFGDLYVLAQDDRLHVDAPEGVEVVVRTASTSSAPPAQPAAG